MDVAVLGTGGMGNSVIRRPVDVDEMDALETRKNHRAIGPGLACRGRRSE